MAAWRVKGLVSATPRQLFPATGNVFLLASFAEVEVDRRTANTLVDFLAYADVRSVIHPSRWGGQVLAARSWG